MGGRASRSQIRLRPLQMHLFIYGRVARRSHHRDLASPESSGARHNGIGIEKIERSCSTTSNVAESHRQTPERGNEIVDPKECYTNQESLSGAMHVRARMPGLGSGCASHVSQSLVWPNRTQRAREYLSG